MGADGSVHYEITGDGSSLSGAAARNTADIKGISAAATQGTSALAGMAAKISLVGTAIGGIGFAGLISRGLQFNKTMGDSEIAIGNVLQQFQGLSEEAAKNEAASAMKQLIELEPKAAGTLADLTAGFLSTVAASQSVGINVEQNIDLVGRFANALGNANIPANQLSQEMRSILTGNIGADSSLARVLNVTNEMVKEASQAGNLYAFLVQKIGKLGEAGDTAAVSFSSLQSAIDKALGKTTQALFQEILKGSKSLTESVDENSAAFEHMGAALGGAAKGAATLFDWLYKAGEGLGIAAAAAATGTSLAEAGKHLQDSKIERDANAKLDKFGVKDDPLKNGMPPGGAGAGIAPAAAPVPGHATNAEGDAAGRHRYQRKGHTMGYNADGKQMDSNPFVDHRTFKEFFAKDATLARPKASDSFNDFFHPGRRQFLDKINGKVDGVPALDAAGGKGKNGNGNNKVKDETAAEKLDAIINELKRIRVDE